MRTSDLTPRLQTQRQAIGLRLRALRQQRGLSQVQLMQLSGVDHKAISRYENGLRNVGVDELTRLADALGVELWQLVRV